VYGIEAINAHNGWAISIVGVTIVFTGLVSLSLVISQLHKVLAVWEDPSKIKTFLTRKKKDIADLEPAEETVPALTSGQKEVLKQFALLVRTQTDPFSLPKLLSLARVSGVADPYAHLNILLKQQIIVPDNAGYFTWKTDTFDHAISKQN